MDVPVCTGSLGAVNVTLAQVQEPSQTFHIALQYLDDFLFVFGK